MNQFFLWTVAGLILILAGSWMHTTGVFWGVFFASYLYFIAHEYMQSRTQW